MILCLGKKFLSTSSTHFKSQLGSPLAETSISKVFDSSLVIAHVRVTVARLKCRRGLVKDFISSQDSHTRSYEANVFKEMYQVADLNGEKFTITVRILAARKHLVLQFKHPTFF